WTRAAIQQLIKNKYGITVPVRSISNYLDRWGMTCQRPTRMAYSQDDVKLKTFMNETYPAIAAKAKKEGAEIYWGDETGINNQEYHVRGFAPKGQTPTVPSFSKVEKINMISAINNKGTCRFMCCQVRRNIPPWSRGSVLLLSPDHPRWRPLRARRRPLPRPAGIPPAADQRPPGACSCQNSNLRDDNTHPSA
ncbi:MAG: winged helix-turn-helix domain-containing protein, partial [Clostridia bacterium]|nr:winged helix-turn-helix domain-containing protein [Clostridia bacterium]